MLVVLVAGISSMKDKYCFLPKAVKVCNKCGAYVYLNEAHSTGAMGPTGCGRA